MYPNYKNEFQCTFAKKSSSKFPTLVTPNEVDCLMTDNDRLVTNDITSGTSQSSMFLLYLPYDRIASPTSFFLFVFFLLLLMKTHTTTETTWNGRIWRFLTLHHNPFRNPHSFCSDSRSTSLGLTEVGTLDLRKLKGAYHLVRKSVNFSLKSNGDVIFPEIPFRNCGVPSEVLLFFRLEGTAEISLPFAKLSSFQSLISRKQWQKIKLQMVSAISFGWFGDFWKTLTIIQRSSQLVYSDKW